MPRPLNGLLLFFLISGCAQSTNISPDPALLPAEFDIEHNRSDLERPVREYREMYTGPIFDTHAHLDPPINGIIKNTFIQEISQSISKTGVKTVVIMPVPNEGQMSPKGRWNGAENRKMLQQTGSDRIKLFCGSEYISNWLNDTYYHGYNKSDINKVLNKLSQDLEDPACLGIGEIGLYHFNKSGRQNIIEYPPTFEPFLEIIGLIVKKGKWIDLHAEPVNPYGQSYENLVFGGYALLFQKYPKLKLILSHTAMTNTTNVRKLLNTYPNIIMNFKPIRKHYKWRNLEPITDSKGRLYNDWATLFEDMPERFILGTDEKFGRLRRGVYAAGGHKYEKKISRMRYILGSLNSGTAKLIAFNNAERIFK